MLDLICDERLRVLDNLIENTLYCKKKSALEKEFSVFLSKYSKSIAFATSDDSRKFLVAKDSKGKDQIHDIICHNLGKVGIFDSLASSTESYGKGSRWDGDLSLAILSVVKKLKDIWRL